MIVATLSLSTGGGNFGINNMGGRDGRERRLREREGCDGNYEVGAHGMVTS